MPFTSTPFHLCGWRDFPTRRAVAAQFGRLSDVAPHLMQAAPSDNVFLYKAWKEALGNYPSYPAQKIGDCLIGQTSVLMGDKTEKPLDSIKVGDEVWTHKQRPRKVLNVISKIHYGDMIAFGTRKYREPEGITLCTPDHLFLELPLKDDCEVWTPAGDFSRTALNSLDRYFNITSGVLDNYERLKLKETEVFCLEIEEDHSFYANKNVAHNCTSFGSAHTVDLLQCVQMVIGKQQEAYKEICTEAIYGMGREIANMLGGGDGCYGAAVAKAVMIGVVPRESVGPYDGNRAKQWGSSGVPADVKKAAADHPVKSTAIITTVEEAQAALSNGYPFIVCSNQGFTMTRDANGVCTPQGSWAHCMFSSACRMLNGKLQFLIDQSWGDNVPSGPLTDDQPSFSFWIDAPVLGRMLQGEDSLTFSSFAGFPGQPLPSNWTYSEFI